MTVMAWRTCPSAAGWICPSESAFSRSSVVERSSIVCGLARARSRCPVCTIAAIFVLCQRRGSSDGGVDVIHSPQRR